MPIKIIFTGPESSGKTTITKAIAQHFGMPWLPEYSRTYLQKLNRPYAPKDLLEIAKGQVAAEKSLSETKSPFIFVDTSILVIKVWSIFKYGYFNFELEKLLRQNLPNYYFLCDWQIPWEFDPLRENPNDRAVLYELYKKELKQLPVPYVELKGNEENRFREAITFLSKIQ